MAVLRSSKRFSEWALLIVALAVVGAICIPLWQWTVGQEPDSVSFTADRIARMLLGPEQIACYACFVWASLILLTRYWELRRQRRAFGLDLLPTEEGVRILPEDARAIRRRVEQLSEPRGPYILSNMIRSALSKFAASRSPQDASETVRTQAEVDMGRLSATMSTVHYLAWAIPALGFLGTVRGIGMALTVTPKVDMELDAFLDRTTRSLAIAFDTTLVALVLSLFLMFLLHSLQRDEEGLVLDSQQYCLENLINRLYDLGPEPAKAAESRPAAAEEPALERVWPV